MIDQANINKHIQKTLIKRKRVEKRFKLYGIAAIAVALGFLIFLLSNISLSAIGAFNQYSVKLDIYFDSEVIDPDGTRDLETLAAANYLGIYKQSMRAAFPDAKSRKQKKALYGIATTDVPYILRDAVLENPQLIGTKTSLWILASDEIDLALKGEVDRALPEIERRVSDLEFGWIDQLYQQERIKSELNTAFFTSGDSREPELAGILGAMAGSFFTLIVCFVLSFSFGILSSIYLEMFARKNAIHTIIEVNINNLAAVPSIVFGLLGLAVFINFLGMPVASPLVGGTVLAIMTLPTVIVASRAALKAVPPSIMEAAYGIGASRLQAVFHHALPLAMPGMLTGGIIGMARALGETAPLLMIGMVAFVVDVPTSFTDKATVLPVQIFLWADSPERAFAMKTAAGILVLLAFLISMNIIAIILRKKYEVRW
ncbi:MAG: phosphate ABC transporter permease PstA [Alphaproteobacteria bacterium]